MYKYCLRILNMLVGATFLACNINDQIDNAVTGLLSTVRTVVSDPHQQRVLSYCGTAVKTQFTFNCMQTLHRHTNMNISREKKSYLKVVHFLVDSMKDADVHTLNANIAQLRSEATITITATSHTSKWGYTQRIRNRAPLIRPQEVTCKVMTLFCAILIQHKTTWGVPARSWRCQTARHTDSRCCPCLAGWQIGRFHLMITCVITSVTFLLSPIHAIFHCTRILHHCIADPQLYFLVIPDNVVFVTTTKLFR